MQPGSASTTLRLPVPLRVRPLRRAQETTKDMAVTRKDLILYTVDDLVSSFLWDDRKEDEELPRGQVEAALATGEITTEEIVAQFRRSLIEGLISQASFSSSAPVPVPLPSGPPGKQAPTPPPTTDDQKHTGTRSHPTTGSDPSSPPCHHTQDT